MRLVEHGDDLESIPVDVVAKALPERSQRRRQLVLAPFFGNGEHASTARGAERLHAEPTALQCGVDDRLDLRRRDARMQLALMHPVLAQQRSHREIWWLHGAPNGRGHPFAAEARALLASLPNTRSAVYYSRPGPQDVAGNGFDGTGRLTGSVLAELDPPRDAQAFLCGPAPFMAAVREALGQLGVPRERVHVEKFTSLTGNPFEDVVVVEEEPSDEAPASLTVTLDGETRSMAWPRQRKLLDRLLEDGMDAPYSCREGQCSACACRVVSGEVKMLHNEVLDAEDMADGIVLACQSLPVTDDVSISYE